MNEKEFFKEVIKNFPELKNDILSWEKDLPHLRMSEIATYTRKLFEGNKQENLLKIIDFIENLIPHANEKLYNTIGVSFVEDLVFHFKDTQRDEIVKLLKPEMTSMYESLKPIFDKDK